MDLFFSNSQFVESKFSFYYINDKKDKDLLFNFAEAISDKNKITCLNDSEIILANLNNFIGRLDVSLLSFIDELELLLINLNLCKNNNSFKSYIDYINSLYCFIKGEVKDAFNLVESIHLNCKIFEKYQTIINNIYNQTSKQKNVSSLVYLSTGIDNFMDTSNFYHITNYLSDLNLNTYPVLHSHDIEKQHLFNSFCNKKALFCIGHGNEVKDGGLIHCYFKEKSLLKLCEFENFLNQEYKEFLMIVGCARYPYVDLIKNKNIRILILPKDNTGSFEFAEVFINAFYCIQYYGGSIEDSINFAIICSKVQNKNYEYDLFENGSLVPLFV